MDRRSRWARGRCDRGEHAVVHRPIPAEPVVQPVAAHHVLGQLGREVGDREGRVRPENGLRAIDPSAITIPLLALGIARPDEQDEAMVGVGRGEHHHGLRLDEARQVVDVGVLAIVVLDVVVADRGRRGGQDHHGRRAGSHPGEHLGAPRLKAFHHP
jgi:hypothetical protein